MRLNLWIACLYVDQSTERELGVFEFDNNSYSTFRSIIVTAGKIATVDFCEYSVQKENVLASAAAKASLAALPFNSTMTFLSLNIKVPIATLFNSESALIQLPEFENSPNIVSEM